MPKQFHFYKKDIILNHSIKKFEKIKEIKEIYIALNKKYQKKYSPFVKKTKKIKFFNGGNYRSVSAKKGIEKLYQNYTHVLIHDAARPNFTIKLVLKLIKELKKNSCVVPAITSYDTTVFEKNYVDRSKIKFLQTPQAFDLKKIYKYHKKIKIKISQTTQFYFFKINKKSNLLMEKLIIKKLLLLRTSIQKINTMVLVMTYIKW